MCAIYSDVVKSPNEEYEYTKHEIVELQKCSTNLIYFLKYVKIITRTGKAIFKPYQFQIDLLNLFNNNRHIICKVARQSGKTIFTCAYLLHYVSFNKDKFIGIVSHKEASAKKILRDIKKMYEELPKWLKPGIIEWNKTSIEFDNGCRIEVSSTNPNAFTGNTINILFVDEAAKIPQNIGSDFYASIFPTLSSIPDSKIIMISTPKGMFNLFHELFTGAEKGRNSFVSYSADWRCVPWKDDTWAKQERKNVGSDQRWAQEYEVTFLGSSSTVITPDILGFLFEESKNPLFYDLEDRLRVYEKPIEYAKYIMGVDTGKGTGNDASTIQVLRVDSTNPIKCEQVATFEHDKTDVYQFSEIVNRLSYYYNGAIMIVENNAEAAPVVNNLWYTYENMNLFCKGTDLGIRATKGTKTKSVLLMKKLIEEGSLKLNDANTIKELGSFIEERGKFFGKDLHDDLVSGLYWACYAFEEKDLFDESPQLINNSEADAWGILADIENNPDDGSWLYEEDKIERKENPNDWLRG